MKEEGLTEDQGAFRKLMRKYRHIVFLSALSILRDPDEAEEVVQEVFLKVHFHLNSLRDQDAFERWLKSITRNTAIDRLRRKTRGGSHIPLDEVAPEDLLSPPADEELLRREAIEEVMRAMDELPEGEREILREHLLEGRGYRELSEKYGLSYHAVVMRIRRAKEKVKEKVLKRLSSMIILPWEKIGKVIGGVAMKLSTKVAITGAVVVILGGAGIWLSHHGEERPAPELGEVKVESRAKVEAPAGVMSGIERKEEELTFEEFNRLLDELFADGQLALDEGDEQLSMAETEEESDVETSEEPTGEALTTRDEDKPEDKPSEALHPDAEGRGFLEYSTIGGETEKLEPPPLEEGKAFRVTIKGGNVVTEVVDVGSLPPKGATKVTIGGEGDVVEEQGVKPEGGEIEIKRIDEGEE